MEEGKRLGRVAFPPAAAAAGGHVVQQQQQERERERKAPPSVGLKHHRPDPRKQLGLRAAMGSYQERRRSIGHRRAQSSDAIDLRNVNLNVEKELTINVPPTPQATSISIQVTPASPELSRSLPLPLPSPPTSPRRIASEPFGGPPSLDQIRRWAIKRDKPTIMIQETPLPSSSAERAKARAALENLNLQPGGGIARRPSTTTTMLKMTPVINVVEPDQPPRHPRSNFAPVRAFSLPVAAHMDQSQVGGGARAAQAQSMMARLSMRGAATNRRLQMPGAGVGGTV